MKDLQVLETLQADLEYHIMHDLKKFIGGKSMCSPPSKLIPAHPFNSIRYTYYTTHACACGLPEGYVIIIVHDTPV